MRVFGSKKSSSPVFGRSGDVDIRADPFQAIALAHQDIGALKVQVNELDNRHLFLVAAVVGIWLWFLWSEGQS